jgi:hypothetical protein
LSSCGQASERLKEQVGRASRRDSKNKSFGGVYLADVREERPWLLELSTIAFIFVDASSVPKIRV